MKYRITVNLEDEEYRALQNLAERTDRSLAWLGRRAICDLITRKEDTKNNVRSEKHAPNERRTG